MRQLIVAADDFGLTKSVNEGMARSYDEGIVTLLNLIPSGEAYDDALSLAKKIGLDEAGAHLALTETVPVTDPSRIRSLVEATGRFRAGNTQFLLKYVFGAINLDEVYLEWKAQLEKLSASGIRITNLSSHEHIHMLPKVLGVLITLAKEFNIPAIRYPHADRSYLPPGVKSAYKALALGLLGANMGRMLKAAGVISPEHFLGFMDSGRITEDVLLKIIADLQDGTTELVCHPGFLGPEVLDRYKFHKNSEAELFALTSRRVEKLIADRGIKLVSYSEFLRRK